MKEESHPIKMNMKVVTAAIMLRDNKVFIAQRRRGDHLEKLWEFPGGKVEDGETPEHCLKREMYEEFGINVEVGQFLWESIYEYPKGVIKLVAYMTTWVGNSLKPLVHDDCRWIGKEELGCYQFAPADIPFLGKLVEEDLLL